MPMLCFHLWYISAYVILYLLIEWYNCLESKRMLISFFFFSSHCYMNIEAIIGGDLLTVASLILEQCNLKKLLGNIEDLCFDQPIRHAIKMRVEVMLPWETSNANNTILQYIIVFIAHSKWPDFYNFLTMLFTSFILVLIIFMTWETTMPTMFP